MMNSRIVQLEARLRVLEDMEALRRLKARYAQYCDLKYKRPPGPRADHLEKVAGLIASLFTEDAVWDGGERFGRAVGRAAIHERFSKDTFRFALHYFLMPDIHVDNDRASGVWYLLQPLTSTSNEAMWVAGLERDEYRRENDTWLISRMEIDLSIMAPHDQGWAKGNLLG